MAVTLEDIDRWQPSAVREVSTALGKRGASADEVKTGLSRLPLIASWQGSSGDAARASLDKLSAHLAAHSEEMQAVAAATNKAADEIESVKETLNGIDRDAKAWGFSIDRATGVVTPTDKSQQGSTLYYLQQIELEQRVTKLLADANAADSDLARALTTAGKDATGPSETRPDVRAALSAPPSDPTQFHDFWQQLTPEEKDWLYQLDHSIGNHAGMPFTDRDHYNRMHLDELQKANQADLDRLRAQHPDWASGFTPGIITRTYEDWWAQWDAANRAHDGYADVKNSLGPPPDKVEPGKLPKYLGIIDDQGHAAVSINNPDTAKRNATFVPGTGQDPTRFSGSADKSLRMYQAARDADARLQPGDVSATTWMGYDRPMDVVQAASTSYAHNGAAALDDFQAGLRASHNDTLTGGPSLNTVIGHSYGSTEVGAAALNGHHLDADNVIAVASPGVLTGHAGDLNLDPAAHVYATRAQNDIISVATGWTLGPDPTGTSFGATTFAAAPGPTWPLGLPSIAAHSSYWSDGNPALDNMGRIIAGRTDVTPAK
jgi:uncharacterized protein YukE